MSSKKKQAGAPGTAVVIKTRSPYVEDREKVDLFKDAFFPHTGSVLIFNMFTVIENLIKEYEKELRKYNRKLANHKIPFRIRVRHTLTEKGTNYCYTGRYIYGTDKKYKGRADNTVLRNRLQEKWNKIGPPPRSELDGISFEIVKTEEGETDCIVVPFGVYTNPKFSKFFSGKKYFRLA
jgi:hypothetical protein